jgi:citrate lyase beta subunit
MNFRHEASYYARKDGKETMQSSTSNPRLTLSEGDLGPVMASLQAANERFTATYPGIQVDRVPVHTVYGGAQLYKVGVADKLAQLARRNLAEFAPTFVDFARALEFEGAKSLPQDTGSLAPLQAALEVDATAVRATNPAAWLAWTVYQRVQRKLEREAVEDQRIDFEDGYGAREDAEEDGHALAAAAAMAQGLQADNLPPFTGIRVKALTEEAKARSLRTLDIFMSTLLSATSNVLPSNFAVTLPKVTSPEQVSAMHQCLSLIEAHHGLVGGVIRLELMIETIQSIINPSGESAIPALMRAGKGRVTCAILGTMDYTATCNIASTHQSHAHPSAEFARMMMQVCLTGTEVTISDGITNVMPIPPHKATPDAPLNLQQHEENRRVVHDAWKLHFDNISHTLRLGIYQSWDLNPAQIPVRYAAFYYFFLTGLEAATARLKTFIDQAAQATLVGNVFDDAATAQGLLNFFISGISCGALEPDEAIATGISMAELQGKSFQKIVENRVNA